MFMNMSARLEVMSERGRWSRHTIRQERIISAARFNHQGMIIKYEYFSLRDRANTQSCHIASSGECRTPRNASALSLIYNASLEESTGVVMPITLTMTSEMPALFLLSRQRAYLRWWTFCSERCWFIQSLRGAGCCGLCFKGFIVNSPMRPLRFQRADRIALLLIQCKLF